MNRTEMATDDGNVQPNLQPTALTGDASQELGTATTVPDVAAAVRQARADVEAMPGQTANAMTIGHESKHLRAALEPVRRAIYDATMSDLGYPANGAEHPPETLRMTVRNLAALDVLVETFWTHLETRGVLTAKGKTRSAMTTFLLIVDRQARLAQVLGLDRRSRSVDLAKALSGEVRR